MSSRERILGRVRRALADVGQDDTPYEQAVPRDYLREHGERSVERTVDLLAENLAEYRAIVHRCAEDELAAVIGRLLAERGSKTVLVPAGLDEEWFAATDAERVPDRGESTPHELDRVDSVVTACAVAVAETGTIVLDGGPDQGRRRITLVPDHHICVVRVPEQVVSAVPQALERLDPARPLTWISGPSATSDIELDRVEGVHGPRSLEVVLVSGRPGAEATS
ncbi:LUD domain-containing protein [Streptomyces sp. NBC_00078]|uniref:LutC/YkgG family protein n=1 Tax=unclassified Streptomyces TaxID=2593676 RepID=UPI002252A0F3|nr:LUD domain-containing protein [Streptomyces sp. NBC_00078]MCX5425581.1 LUD domain-containing protein [Streptomyces sp. NBC_00078]